MGPTAGRWCPHASRHPEERVRLIVVITMPGAGGTAGERRASVPLSADTPVSVQQADIMERLASMMRRAEIPTVLAVRFDLEED